MQNYSTIIGVIELRQQSVGYATTQKRYGIGSSTVTLIMKRFKELGLTLEELRAMPPRAVEVAFYPPENLKRSEKPMPDFAKIHARMSAMKQPNLAFVWLEYKEEHPDGYQLSLSSMRCTARSSLRTSDRHPSRCQWNASPASVCILTG